MSSCYRAVLFDFGGVFTASPFDALDALGPQFGAARPGQLREIVFGAYHSDGDHPWHRLERGEISLEAAREAILALGRAQGVAADLWEILGALPRDGGAGLKQPLVEHVRYLRRAGFRTGVVTNNVREFSAGWRGLLPVDELFEFVVDSCEVGVRKPSHGIFRIALEMLGDVEAGECIYLDDYPANVEAANALGMRGIHVTPDVERTIRDLEWVVARCG